MDKDKNLYRVVVEWDVEASDDSEAQTFVWDCIDGHIGIVNVQTMRLVGSPLD